MRMRRFVATLSAAVATTFGAVVVAPAPAQAATSWSLSGTAGDAYGVWAYGTWWWSGGRLYLQVNVKDTAADGYGARVGIIAYYNDGGTRGEVVHNSGGSGTTVTRQFNFAGNVTKITGGECAVNIGSACVGPSGRIY
ncbi:hypothetical protein KZZ52_33890 [Dactylosporangium sp. AC04546]|uniref:hypothetical protein n=1 Tax=Dactylosporangium sp. AC04546 TaxID=2862460 RepID=UPI001EE1178D|nr:hypothetical protein [Dactylosporangium sp. AC04546]WVK78966.1 hypothetical protein KZZ52_33890 [Dactylosporangium sp. AC04546]